MFFFLNKSTILIKNLFLIFVIHYTIVWYFDSNIKCFYLFITFIYLLKLASFLWLLLWHLITITNNSWNKTNIITRDYMKFIIYINKQFILNPLNKYLFVLIIINCPLILFEWWLQMICYRGRTCRTAFN